MLCFISRSVQNVSSKNVENVGTKSFNRTNLNKGKISSWSKLKNSVNYSTVVQSAISNANSNISPSISSDIQISNQAQNQSSNIQSTNLISNQEVTRSFKFPQKRNQNRIEYFGDKIEDWPKKSDMYLVRSDGNSCTREFVRGSGKLTFAFPSANQHLLIWRQRPKTVLIIKKMGSSLLQEFKQVVEFLGEEKGMKVIVEPADYQLLQNMDNNQITQNINITKTKNTQQNKNNQNKNLKGDFIDNSNINNNGNFMNQKTINNVNGVSSTNIQENDDSNSNFQNLKNFVDNSQINQNINKNDYLHTFRKSEIEKLADIVDFVVCLGGDGVILHVSDLFKKTIPPIISFHLGSLGFLTNHEFSNFRKDLTNVIDGSQDLHNCQFDDSVQGVNIALRMRLQCEVFQKGTLRACHDVLNEVVIDRGVNSYLSNIEVYESGKFITTVQGDGVMLATPTGSTAYSVAAGGSMVHPNVSSILFTPICPHSLSFKPVILPDYAVIELRVPESARASARVSFDGKHSVEVEKGDWVRVRMSTKPVPTINQDNLTNDWFASLDRCFGWSNRQVQKPLN